MFLGSMEFIFMMMVFLFFLVVFFLGVCLRCLRLLSWRFGLVWLMVFCFGRVWRWERLVEVRILLVLGFKMGILFLGISWVVGRFVWFLRILLMMVSGIE